MSAIWTGVIGFGLVNIPVKMFSAIESTSLDLDMLDAKDHSNIKFKRINENTGKEVAWDQIVKGYLHNDKYVVLEQSDFDKAAPEKSKTLAIDSFVDEKEIDSVYMETPYFLEPQKNGENAYVLLYEALKKTGKCGMGTFILRNKEALGILRVYENILVFQRIRFAAEIRPTDHIKVPKRITKPAELKMAISLVGQLTEKFQPERYEDTYTENLLKLINAKAKGKKSTVKKAASKAASSTDLLIQLKQSLKKPTRKAS